jgi:Tol biopolymer transport system component
MGAGTVAGRPLVGLRVARETGVPQVFVRPFPGVQDGKWQISSEGALDPVWSADGRELFFRSTDGQSVIVADMARGPSLAARRDLFRAPLDARFELNGDDRMFEPGVDGRRFLLMRQGSGDLSGNLVVVQNFVTELRAALAGGTRP